MIILSNPEYNADMCWYTLNSLLRSCLERYRWYHENGSFSVQFFNKHYLSIPLFTSSWGTVFRKHRVAKFCPVCGYIICLKKGKLVLCARIHVRMHKNEIKTITITIIIFYTNTAINTNTRTLNNKLGELDKLII